MRGHPLWQLLGVALAFGLLGIPVWAVTAGSRQPAAAAPAAAPPPPQAQAQTLEVQAEFLPAPADFQLRYLADTVVLAGQGPAAQFAGRWTVVLPPEGADLILQARWPEGAPGRAAARVTLRWPDGRQVEKTLWGDAAQPMTEVVPVDTK